MTLFFLHTKISIISIEDEIFLQKSKDILQVIDIFTNCCQNFRRPKVKGHLAKLDKKFNLGKIYLLVFSEKSFTIDDFLASFANRIDQFYLQNDGVVLSHSFF